MVEVCRDLGVSEPTFYRGKKRFGYLGVSELRELRSRIREIATARVSYAYRRVHVLLRREGWPINGKRVYRLYREEGLFLRAKRPKRRRMAVARQTRPAVAEPNQRRATEFMSDALHDGRRLRVLTVVDTCTRECVALEARGTFRSEEVAAV